MKISTQGRYGLRALVDLATNKNSGAIPLREISRREDISERYLEQLFAKLRKAGIVRSVRGAHGGYLLNHPLEEITVGDVIRVLEGSIVPVECVNDEGKDCERSRRCVTREVWKELKNQVDDYLDSITLHDLKERAEELNRENDQGHMYYI